MMVDIDSSCDQMLEGISRWIKSLPQDVATMKVMSLERNDEIIIEIEPSYKSGASPVRLGVVRGSFRVSAGKYFHTKEIACSTDTALEYCQAVVSGRLVETSLMRKGQVIETESQLCLDGKRHTRYWRSRLSGVWGWAELRRKLRKGYRRHKVQYPPYYELVPSAHNLDHLVLTKPPVFIHEHWSNDLALFPTIQEAEGSIEAIDVLNDEYAVYDSEGRMLQAIVPGNQRQNEVRILAVDEKPLHALDLSKLLVHLLQYTGGAKEAEPWDAWLSHASLEELAMEASKYMEGPSLLQ